MIEDAGDHPGNPGEFHLALRTLLEGLNSLSGVTYVLTTTADFMSDRRRQDVAPANFHWKAPLHWHERKTQASLNQIILELGHNFVSKGMNLRLIDFHSEIERLQREFLSQNIDFMHSDQVHPNVFGQCVLSAMVLKAFDPATLERLYGRGRMRELLLDNLLLSGDERSPEWDPWRSSRALNACLDLLSENESPIERMFRLTIENLYLLKRRLGVLWSKFFRI